MHSTSIQTTTKSVHEETVRVVDQQIKDLDVQMKDLDDFVTRAKTQNAEHHEQHAESMRNLDDAVEKSFTSVSERFVSTFDRVHQLSQDMDLDVKGLGEAQTPLDEEIIQPLSSLREDIRNTLLQEYEPTGETPARVQYEYPTDLPRTQPHDILIAGMRDAPTPSKPAPVQIPVIFGDAVGLVGGPPVSPSQVPLPNARPSSSGRSSSSTGPGHHLQHMETPAARQRTLSVSTVRSLREVNPNLSATTSIKTEAFDPSASTMSLAMPAIGEDENTINLNQTAPLLKRSVTAPGTGAGAVTGAVKSTRFSARRQMQQPTARGVVSDGVENLPPTHLLRSERGLGGSRRKSPRLN